MQLNRLYFNYFKELFTHFNGTVVKKCTKSTLMYRIFFKRSFDIIGSLILLPFVIITILLIGPIIWLSDKGPIFYNSIRNGSTGRTFKMYKLRSMFLNSPDLRNADGSTFNSDSDIRVMKVGRFIRKTSVDEFPQIINVLIGDMSFVGPRPTFGKVDYSTMEGAKKKRYSIKPGITGYAQAYYRNSINQDEKYEYDAYYADNISFIMDVKIILKTIRSVLFRKNINTEQSYKK